MPKQLVPTDTFCVSFNTRETPGKIRCVQVTLRHQYIGPDDSVRLDLCDHPLYPELVAYCLSNPPGGK